MIVDIDSLLVPYHERLHMPMLLVLLFVLFALHGAGHVAMVLGSVLFATYRHERLHMHVLLVQRITAWPLLLPQYSAGHVTMVLGSVSFATFRHERLQLPMLLVLLSVVLSVLVALHGAGHIAMVLGSVSFATFRHERLQLPSSLERLELLFEHQPFLVRGLQMIQVLALRHGLALLRFPLALDFVDHPSIRFLLQGLLQTSDLHL